MTRKIYFFLQLKRSLLAFSHMLAGMVISLLLVLLLALGISSYFESVQMLQTVSIGIVLPEATEETELLVNLVSKMDSVESICTFSFLEEEELFDKLKAGTIQAGISLPEDFYEDVNNGINTPLTIYYADTESLSSGVFQELLHDGLSYVQVTEAAIYAAESMGDVYTLSMEKTELENFLSQIYLTQVFRRGNTFNRCVLSPTGQVNLTQYYVVVGSLAFLLLMSLNFGFLYQNGEKELDKKLRLFGVNWLYSGLVRLCIQALYLYLFLLLGYGVGCLLILSWDIKILLGLMPLSFALAAFFHLIRTIAREENQGTLLLLGCNAFLLICSGGILPSAYFPKALQWLGDHLPFAVWMNYLENLLFGHKGQGMWPLLCMALIFLGIAGLISYGREQRA